MPNDGAGDRMLAARFGRADDGEQFIRREDPIFDEWEDLCNMCHTMRHGSGFVENDALYLQVDHVFEVLFIIVDCINTAAILEILNKHKISIWSQYRCCNVMHNHW